jgi:hypothetical protein
MELGSEAASFPASALRYTLRAGRGPPAGDAAMRRSRPGTMLVALALPLALSLALALPPAGTGAAAQSLGIEAFYGSFYGAGIAEAAPGQKPPDTVTRDTNVEIKPAPGGGFAVTWSAVSHTAALQAPKDRTVTVEFRPAARPGEFEAARASGAAGGERYWARLHGQTLTVVAEGATADGRRDTQQWDRTMSGGQMRLLYVRSSDGRPVFSVRSSLVRMAR